MSMSSEQKCLISLSMSSEQKCPKIHITTQKVS